MFDKSFVQKTSCIFNRKMTCIGKAYMDDLCIFHVGRTSNLRLSGFCFQVKKNGSKLTPFVLSLVISIATFQFIKYLMSIPRSLFAAISTLIHPIQKSIPRNLVCLDYTLYFKNETVVFLILLFD